MCEEIGSTHAETYRHYRTENGTPVRLPVDVEGFSGPLDLLLLLITKREIDIFRISLASIADAYLAVIRDWEKKDLDLAGEYLVLAAALVRYKSKNLLPPEDDQKEEEEETEISDELLRQRQKEYERFREAAAHLRRQEQRVSSLFPRLGPTAEQPEEVIEFAEVSVYDLYATFKRILDEIGGGEIPAISPEEFSVDEKMLELETLVMRESPLLLSAYLRTFVSRMEVIVTFLALLELIRLKVVKAHQERQHGEIWLVRGPAAEETADREMEEAPAWESNARGSPKVERVDDGDSAT